MFGDCKEGCGRIATGTRRRHGFADRLVWLLEVLERQWGCARHHGEKDT